jgi:hypothetical protein
METRSTQTVARQTSSLSIGGAQSDAELAKQRLEVLLTLNAENAREKSMYRSEWEKTEAALMENPLSVEATYAFFRTTARHVSAAGDVHTVFRRERNFSRRGFLDRRRVCHH